MVGPEEALRRAEAAARDSRRGRPLPVLSCVPGLRVRPVLPSELARLLSPADAEQMGVESGAESGDSLVDALADAAALVHQAAALATHRPFGESECVVLFQAH